MEAVVFDAEILPAHLVEQGFEYIAVLGLPMRLNIAAAVLHAICKAAERDGWTEVNLLTDGTNRIMGKPPARGAEALTGTDTGR